MARTLYPAQVYVTISPVATGLYDVSKAYRDGDAGPRVQESHGLKRDPGENIMASLFDKGYYYPIDVEYKLSSLMRQGDCARCEKIWTICLEINLSDSVLSSHMTSCLLYELLGTLSKVNGGLSTRSRSAARRHRADRRSYAAKRIHRKRFSRASVRLCRRPANGLPKRSRPRSIRTRSAALSIRSSSISQTI